MEASESHYLELQFLERIYLLRGTEFQSFVEKILEKKYPDFEKVRPYGNRGDGGNDGYRRDGGIYYQVYAPEDPSIKDGEAAKKLRGDFENVYSKWNHLTKIKEYNFVFNDQYSGTNILIEEEKAKLKAEYPEINFTLILSRHLKAIFFSLSESQILSLHFNLERSNARELANSFLDILSVEIDRENVDAAFKVCESAEGFLSILKDDSYAIKHAVLKARCFQKNEDYFEARDILEEKIQNGNESISVLLAASENAYTLDDIDKCNEYFNRAKQIDENDLQVILVSMLRSINLDEEIDLTVITPEKFQGQPKKLSTYFRLMAIINMSRSNIEESLRCINEAITNNPEKFENYRLHLDLVGYKLFEEQNISKKIAGFNELIKNISQLEYEFGGEHSLSIRSKVFLNKLKLDSYAAIYDQDKFSRQAYELLLMCMECFFDKSIDHVLATVFSAFKIEAEILKNICAYLIRAEKRLSDNLCKALIAQFNYQNSLHDVGLEFFEKVGNEFSVNLINLYINRDFKKIREILNNDFQLCILFIGSITNPSTDIIELIEELELDDFQKQRLKFHYLCDSNDLDGAFKILRKIDLDKISPYEVEDLLNVASKFDAWDIEIHLIKKILEIRKGDAPLNFKLGLFNALYKSKKYPEVINLGIELLKHNDEIISVDNKKIIYINTLSSCFERLKFDNNYAPIALRIINDNDPALSSEYTELGIIPEIYLLCEKYQEALASIISGISNKRGLTENEYSKFFFVYGIRIGNHIDFERFLLDEVVDGAFVHLSPSNDWYFVGDGDQLDAFKVEPNSKKYIEFIGKRLGQNVNTSGEFSTEESYQKISLICKVEKYILERIKASFNKLSSQDLVPGVTSFHIKHVDGEVDQAALLETIEKITNPENKLFDMYCNGPVPFAFLATNQGGFVGAMRKILSSKNAFLNFSPGTLEEFQNQLDTTKFALGTNAKVYIDGTSAAFLVEFGLFNKVFELFQNLVIPHSVYLLICSLAEYFRENVESEGRLFVREDKIEIKRRIKGENNPYYDNFIAAVTVCESAKERVELISDASKENELLEKNILPEFSDAVILARARNAVVLTDDFIYLKANEVVFQNSHPRYFSSFSLVRVLYETGEISFKQYLEYFYYASSYKFRFLSISPDDLERAILGDGLIMQINLDNLGYFNLNLTLSEEYGVTEEVYTSLIAQFLTRMLIDNSITPEIYGRLLVYICSAMPSSVNRVDFLAKTLKLCRELFEKLSETIPINLMRSSISQKLSKFSATAQLYK